MNNEIISDYWKLYNNNKLKLPCVVCGNPTDFDNISKENKEIGFEEKGEVFCQNCSDDFKRHE